MKKLIGLGLALVLLSPVAAFAGSSTDAALGLGAFAVFNQILGGVGIFGGPRPAPVYAAPAPVVYAPPPPPVYVAPAPVYVAAAPVYVAPAPVYFVPPPVVVVPRPVVMRPPVIVTPAPVFYHPVHPVPVAHPHPHW